MAEEAKGTILTVDDEADIRKLTAMYAESIGFKVVEAEDGQAALDLLNTVPVDIIVSDMKMPRMDGLTFIRELRDRGDQTPFLFLSAFTSKEYTVQALSLGAFDYLEKPFLPDELKALMREMLRVSKARQTALVKAGISISAKHRINSTEAEILRISTLRGDASPSIIDVAATGGNDHNARLMIIFINEAQQQMDHGLKALTDLRHTEVPGWQVGYLFRLMNSIKSTAQSLGLSEIRDLAAAMEQIYVLLRVRVSYINRVNLGMLNTAHVLLRRHLDQLSPSTADHSDEQTRLKGELQATIKALRTLAGTK